MRVLILADSCNPDWPSLPVVGFKVCRALGNHAEVVVATHVRNRENIDRVGFGACEVVYLDNEYIAARMSRLSSLLRGGTSVNWTTNIAMNYPSYLAFEREAWRHFGKELKADRFDVVHRITPMSPTLPSPMAVWSPAPFVLGPLNGGLKWPPQFRRELKREREWLTYVRQVYRYLPYHAKTYRHSAAILAGFSHTIADLPEGIRDRTIDFAEVGFDPEVFAGTSAPRPPRERLTLLYAGRLVPYKCPDVAVRVMAASPLLRKHRLRIVGDGPDRPYLDQLVAEHNLQDCVEFVGRLDQAGVGQAMREADLFIFPSIRELGAGVLVEAMACGLPCAVVDYGAPGNLVDDTRGLRVPLGTKDELVSRLAAGLEQLVQQPERLARLGATAQSYVETYYTWDARARFIVEVYKWVLGKRGDKPVFPDTLTPGTGPA